jgi:hypothetical protein
MLASPPVIMALSHQAQLMTLGSALIWSIVGEP